jgi:cytochrome d ubiquinol oxidase subunit I
VVPVLRDGAPWILDGSTVTRAEIVDFWAVVFNPSTVHRLVHVWIGAFIMGAFFILSISSYYLLRRRHEEFARRSSSGALLLATVASVAILASGHFQSRNVHRHQPAKLAAFEGHFETGRGDLAVFGIPDEARGELRASVAIPGLLGFLVHDEFGKDVVGLDRFRPEDRPPVLVPFLSYRLMVGTGVLFAALTLYASFLLRRGTLWRKRWLLWIFVLAVVPAALANQSGWVAAEVGRQPWIVHPPIPRDAAGELALGPDGVVVYDEAEGLRTEDSRSSASSTGYSSSSGSSSSTRRSTTARRPRSSHRRGRMPRDSSTPPRRERAARDR